MNLLDIAILGIIGASIAFGLYAGLISSALSIFGFLIAWLCAGIMYPSLSGWIAQNTSLLDTIIHYTEGASHLSSLEVARSPVAGQTAAAVWEIINTAKFPAPFDTMLFDNISAQALAQTGLVTFADYFNYTLAYAALNILSFLMILFTVFTLFSVINIVVCYITKFPVLRHCDALLGGVFGMARGILLVMVLFMLLPVVLASLPLDFLNEMVTESNLAPFFYDGNFILNSIKSIL